MSNKKRKKKKSGFSYALLIFLLIVGSSLLTVVSVIVLKTVADFMKKKTGDMSSNNAFIIVEELFGNKTSENDSEIREPEEGDLILYADLNDDNTATLYFYGLRSAEYAIMRYDGLKNEWFTIKDFAQDEDQIYTTETLPSQCEVRFKVCKYSADGSDFARESEEISIRTGITAVGCKIWPIKDLEMLDGVGSKNSLGKIRGGDCALVVDSVNGYFKVSYCGQDGYIQSDYCLINLPDYIGDVCLYNITNSYSSQFNVNNYSIPMITGEVLPGYEDVCVAEGEYLVPFLYPCANRLYEAAQAAQADGYKLKIYEAYRPHETSSYLYNTVTEVLDHPVMEYQNEGDDGIDLDSETGEGEDSEEPVLSDEELANRCTLEAMLNCQAQGVDYSTEEGLEYLKKLAGDIFLQRKATGDYTGLPIGEGATYRQEMTNGSMNLSAFLAKSISAHNRGIALDLTLADAASGEDLEMQSAMHDLSYHSITARNNDNAKLLKKYMVDAGFNSLSSEWWHFQDDKTRNRINLGVYLENGVNESMSLTPEG